MWELYREQPDGRWLYDHSLQMDGRDIGPECLINPRPGRITLIDGSEVDVTLGDGGLAVTTCAARWAHSEPYADEDEPA